MRIPILTYQPLSIGGNDYRSSDLKALAADLDLVTQAGLRILPLRSIVDAWLDNRGAELDGRIVAVTCDKGADFDFFDLPHPRAGPQRSVLNILRDFQATHPGAQDALNVTSFVIVSPEARAVLDAKCMFAKGWWNDQWWPEAVRSGLMHIGNQSWDHNHETLPPSLLRSRRGGTFLSIDSGELADHEIRTAAEYLGRHAPNPGTGLFAYPYGEANSYLVREYFPAHAEALGIRAALTDRPGFLEPGTGRWEVPRFVFGRDWRSPGELQAILDAAATRHAWVPVRSPPAQVVASATPQPIEDLKGFEGFVARHANAIPGWMLAEAALFTAHLAWAQRAMRVTGPTLEIGVYKGKYLSVLYQLSGSGEEVLGVDLFGGGPDAGQEAASVRENIAAACGDASRLKLLISDSMRLTSDALLREAGGEPFRFISIDGGHTAQIVLHDLETTYSALREGGILALDDIFNPGVPGVAEGIAAFFLGRKPALAPFAYCYNKLFVTTPTFHRRYLREAERFLDAVPWLPLQERTLRSLGENRANNFTPELFGYEILSFEAG